MLLRPLATIGLLTCLSTPLALAQTTFSIDSRGTYLRTNQDTPQLPLIISLVPLGLSPGDRLSIEALGDFDCGGPCADDRVGLIAVFSSTDQLLAANQLHRVPGAVDAGADVTTAATYHGGLPTDIPEDFWVRNGSSVQLALCLRVPADAQFLFFSSPDHLFYDNTDPDADYAVRITPLPPCDADIDQDCAIGQSDIGILLANWEQTVPPGALGDLNNDGVINQSDLGIILADYGLACP